MRAQVMHSMPYVRVVSYVWSTSFDWKISKGGLIRIGTAITRGILRGWAWWWLYVTILACFVITVGWRIGIGERIGWRQCLPLIDVIIIVTFLISFIITTTYWTFISSIIFIFGTSTHRSVTSSTSVAFIRVGVEADSAIVITTTNIMALLVGGGPSTWC